jgi:DNA-binding response OmpR family regulator
VARTVLIFEDDDSLRSLIRETLAIDGYRVLEAETAAIGLHLFSKEKPDLVILDINLPGEDGISICRKIRAHSTQKATPVIMLTARTEFDSKKQGFDAGADHYLTKPFPPQELLLWAGALLRRLEPGKDEPNTLTVGELTIDVAAHLVHYKGQRVDDLTGKEFDLLYFLVKKRPQVVSRKQVLSQLWHTVAVDRLVDTHLSNLRKKIPQELSDKLQTVPGKGFRYLE